MTLWPKQPFVVSPSNHEWPFDKLRTNGKFLPTGNNQKTMMNVPSRIDSRMAECYVRATFAMEATSETPLLGAARRRRPRRGHRPLLHKRLDRRPADRSPNRREGGASDRGGRARARRSHRQLLRAPSYRNRREAGDQRRDGRMPPRLLSHRARHRGGHERPPYRAARRQRVDRRHGGRLHRQRAGPRSAWDELPRQRPGARQPGQLDDRAGGPSGADQRHGLG